MTITQIMSSPLEIDYPQSKQRNYWSFTWKMRKI